MKKGLIFFVIIGLIFSLSGCKKQDVSVEAPTIEDPITEVAVDGWTLENGVLRIEKQIEDVIPWDSERENIEKIEISQNVVSVPIDSFVGCVNLKEVHFYDSFKLNYSEFWKCYSLSKVYIETIGADSVPIVEEAFRDCSGAIIYLDSYNIVVSNGILIPIPISVLGSLNYDISSDVWNDCYFNLISFSGKDFENDEKEIKIVDEENEDESEDVENIKEIEDFIQNNEDNLDSANLKEDYLFRIFIVDATTMNDFVVNKHELEHVFARGVGNKAGCFLVIHYSPLFYEYISMTSEEINGNEIYNWVVDDLENDIILYNDFIIEEIVEWQPPVVIDENLGPGGEVLSEEEILENEDIENIEDEGIEDLEDTDENE